MISVAHVRQRIPGAVYAGRPGPFGNPFVLQRESERERVLLIYRQWFYGPSTEAADVRARALALPDDAVLACFCHPKACHADVIAEFVNKAREQV